MGKIKLAGNYIGILSNLAEAHNELSKLMDQVIKDPSVRFKNDYLINCWEAKDCRKKNCPVYKKDDLRCWQIAGTFCGDKVQGDFAKKIGDCRKCEVFLAACQTQTSAIGEQFNN